jgi:hypothetical protein
VSPRPVGARPHHTVREAVDTHGNYRMADRPLLIGFDFAFGFPFEPDLGYFAGRAPLVENIFDLWSLIETKSRGESDFGCIRFANDPDYSSLFWTTGQGRKDGVNANAGLKVLTGYGSVVVSKY